MQKGKAPLKLRALSTFHENLQHGIRHTAEQIYHNSSTVFAPIRLGPGLYLCFLMIILFSSFLYALLMKNDLDPRT